MSEAVATETKPESVAERKLPEIRPAHVQIHHAGFCSKHVVIQAPVGLTITDLNEHPEIWRHVQADRGGRALSEFDLVEIRFQDMLVTARVNHSTHNSVTLFDIKRVSKPQRDVQLFEDDEYAVKWRPEGGYGFVRKRDNVWMSSGSWPTPESAKQELFRQMYPPKDATPRII